MTPSHNGALLVLLAAGSTAWAQSESALRFFGTGTSQQDRVRIPVDDNAPGPDASTPCDVGAASFTIDFWLRGSATDNTSANAGGDRACDCFNWIEGNILVDRDIYGASDRDWGIAVAGGFIRFGVGRGDAPGWNEHTIEGSTPVLTGAWTHVACVRDFDAGQLRVYVNGVLDFAGPANRHRADLSYPNSGDPAPVTPWGPFIVLAAEKHDADPANYPSFSGFLDEFRVWDRALAPAEIESVRALVLTPGAAQASGLVGMYRLEEGAGTTAADSSASGSPVGTVIAGVPGNAQWVLRAIDAGNTAPVSSPSSCPGDLNGDGTINTADLAALLGVFGGAAGPGEPADFNADGAINTADLAVFLGRFGAPC